MEQKRDYIQDIIASTNIEYKLSDGAYFNHKKTIERVFLYLNDRFFSLNNNDNKYIFWNLWTTRRQNFAKNYDIDTKDLVPEGVGETSFVQAWILKTKLSKWFRDSNMAMKIDDMELNAADYGSAIWKTTEKFDDKNKKFVDVELCDLKRIYFYPLTSNLRKENIVEEHEMTEKEIKEKDDVWEKIDEALKSAMLVNNNNYEKKYKIYEFWGEIKDGKNYKFVHRFCTGGSERDVVLYESEEKRENLPYYDFHLLPYTGRWLRIGGVERLFHYQQRANELCNQSAEASKIASTLLLKSANPELHGSNALEIENGVIISDPSLQQLALGNPAFNSFISEMNFIENQADKLCMTPSVITGEQNPSSVPFRSTVIITNAARSAFRMTRVRIGEQISKIVLEVILPKIAKQWNSGDIYELAGDEKDLKIYDDSIVSAQKINIAKNYFIYTGNMMSQEEFDSLNTVLKEKIGMAGRKIELPKGYFNFDYGIRINATGEIYDRQQQNDAYYNAITMVMANPSINNIPMFKQYCSNNGIEWWKLSQEQQNELMAMAMAGGGSTMSAPKGQDKLMAEVEPGSGSAKEYQV